MRLELFRGAIDGASMEEVLTDNEAWEYLRRQIVQRALQMSDHPSFDFRRLLTQARNAQLAGRLMWNLIRRFDPQVLIGPGFGAAPLLFATALAARADGADLSILMVRDKRKEHNCKKWVEGQRQPAGSRAVLIDDFLGQGSAITLVEQALQSERQELDITAVALFFDMWNPLGSRQISVHRYPVVSLFKRHDIGLTRDAFDARPPLMRGSFPTFVGAPRWWRVTLNERRGYPLKCTPVVTDDAVFAIDDCSRVFRHNGVDGSIEWTYESLQQPPKGIVQVLQHAEDSLVFGCYDGTLTRLDKRTGAIIWRWRLDSSIHATPELDLAHQRLFVNTEQYNEGKPFGHLYCIDWKTGRTLWRLQHGYWPPGSPAYSPAHNLVIATCNDRSVVCVDADTGEPVWHDRKVGLVRGKPAIKDQYVFIANERGFLHCFDIVTGVRLWARPYGKPAFHQFLHIHKDTVYVLDGKWHLTAFDCQSGAIRWMFRLRAAGCWTPVVCERYLVVLSEGGQLAVIDPDKDAKVWEGGIGGRYTQPPAIGRVNGKLVLVAASLDQGLKVFEIDNFYG
jgi:outer membrane protein assembly factor BamB/orotate phosphoribosyltransferase